MYAYYPLLVIFLLILRNLISNHPFCNCRGTGKFGNKLETAVCKIYRYLEVSHAKYSKLLFPSEEAKMLLIPPAFQKSKYF